MNLENCIVLAGEFVWQGVDVYFVDGTLTVFSRNENGGLDVEIAFSNVGGYTIHGQSYIWSGDGGPITDSDGDTYDQVKVLTKRKCGCR